MKYTLCDEIAMEFSYCSNLGMKGHFAIFWNCKLMAVHMEGTMVLIGQPAFLGGAFKDYSHGDSLGYFPFDWFNLLFFV